MAALALWPSALNRLWRCGPRRQARSVAVARSANPQRSSVSGFGLLKFDHSERGAVYAPAPYGSTQEDS